MSAWQVLIWRLVFNAVLLLRMGGGNVCDLTSSRFQDLPGDWHHTETAFSPLGYQEKSCPDIVHLTDCLRQSMDPTKTAEAYSMRFSPTECEFRDFTPQDAADCLGQNTKLLFIGDSMSYSQFESMACFLRPVTLQTQGSRLFDGENFATFTQSKYAGDLNLTTGASVHMRGIQSYSAHLWETVMSTMPTLTSKDIVVVNEGAHHIYNVEAYKSTMTDIIMKQLRPLPATVYWREYAPAHFGGPSGAFVPNPSLPRCEQATVGEPEWNQIVKDLLLACGNECSHIKWLPIFKLSLPRHSMHAGDHIDQSVRGNWATAIRDCRHYCLPVLDYWNILLLHSMCPPEGEQVITHGP